MMQMGDHHGTGKVTLFSTHQEVKNAELDFNGVMRGILPV
jgi:hypothetical protein